ncbi:MAG: hypothetical protein IJY72_06670, partial [Akkermansia sp.]|nr:hypothetical protein [Akkermansia sp.]
LGVFNANLMNDAIFMFKRYEDSSLSYTGVDKHAGKDIGGWDTVIKRAEYDQLFYNQQATMEAPTFIEAMSVPKAPASPPPKAVTPPVQQKPAVAPTKPKTAAPLVTSQYGIKPTAPVAKPAQAPAFVAPDVSEGDSVIHKAFGEGTVTKLDKAQKHIRVKFAIGEKTFIFPDAFKNGFLSMKD